MTAFLDQRFGLGDQVAVVFGGASGIGKVSAQFLARAGAAVCIADLQQDAAEAVADAIRSEGGRAAAVSADVSQDASVRQAIEGAEAELGPVTLLLNSAGIFPSVDLDDLSADDWDRIQAINLRGAFLCIREGARAMRRSGRPGRLILISSTTSLSPGIPSLGAYSAAKAGVNALVRTAAIEYAADGITVNAILPGDTQTEGAMNAVMAASALARIGTRLERRPIARMATPEDIAQAVLTFAAPGAAYWTGQTLVIDGGMLTTG